MPTSGTLPAIKGKKPGTPIAGKSIQPGEAMAAAWNEGNSPQVIRKDAESMNQGGPTAAAWNAGSGPRVTGKAFIAGGTIAPQLIAAAEARGPDLIAAASGPRSAVAETAAEPGKTGASAGGVNPPFTFHIGAELSGPARSGMTIQDLVHEATPAVPEGKTPSSLLNKKARGSNRGPFILESPWTKRTGMPIG